MPRFPVLPQRTSAPAAFSNTPRAQAADFGAGIGRNLSKLGSEAVELGQVIEQRQERQVKQQMSQFDLDLAKQRAQSDAQAPPEEASDAKVERYQSIFEMSAEKLLQGYEGQGLQSRLREDIELRREAYTQKLLAGEAQQRLGKSLQDAWGLVDHWAGRVTADASEFSTASLELLGDEASGEAGLLAGLGLRPEALVAWRGHVLGQLLEAQMQSDPAGLLADLEAGRWQEVLPEERGKSLLEDAEEALARRQSAEGIKRQQMSAMEVLELSQGIEAGRAGMADIRRAAEAGVLSSPQAEALRVEAERAEIVLQAHQMANDELAISLSSGVGFDLENPQNRQAADSFYETTYSQAIREGASEATRALVVSAVARIGYLSPRLARDTTGLLLGRDENFQIQGAELYGLLREAAPKLVEESIDLVARAWGGVLKRWLDTGLEPSDALRRAKEEMQREGAGRLFEGTSSDGFQRDLSLLFEGENSMHRVRQVIDQLESNYLEDLGRGLAPRQAKSKLRRDAVKLLFRLGRLREELIKMELSAADEPEQNLEENQQVPSLSMLLDGGKREGYPLFATDVQNLNEALSQAAAIELQESHAAARDGAESYGFELSSNFWRAVAKAVPELAATTGYAIISLGELEAYLGKVTEETQDGRFRSVQIIRPIWGRTTVRQLKHEKGGGYTNVDGAYFDYRLGREQRVLLTGEHETGKKWPPLAPIGADIEANITLAERSWNPLWFEKQVQNKGPWDFKQLGKAYENFGNFHYGAVGAAMGIFPDIVLFNEAGRAQKRRNTSKPEWGGPGPRYFPFFADPPYGDDPRDQYWIKQGMDYYRNRKNWHEPIELGP